VVGAGQQCFAEPVGEHAHRALQQQQPASTQDRRHIAGSALGAEWRHEVLDDLVGDRAGQSVQPVAHGADEIEHRGDRHPGVDPVRGQRQKCGATDEELLLAVRGDETNSASVPQDSGVQSGQPGLQLGLREPQRRLVQRDRPGVDAEDRAQVGAVVAGFDKVFDRGERVAAPLEAGDHGQPLRVVSAVDTDAPLPARGRKQAHRLVLADGPHRQLRPAGQLVHRELGRARLARVGHQPGQYQQ